MLYSRYGLFSGRARPRFTLAAGVIAAFEDLSRCPDPILIVVAIADALSVGRVAPPVVCFSASIQPITS